MITLFLWIATSTIVILCLLPLWRHEAWWVRSMDFPRLQLFYLCIALLAVQLIVLPLDHFGSWVLLIICLSCLFYQFAWIYPYTPLSKVEVQKTLHPDGPPSIRILTANVLATNRQADKLLKLIKQHDPDIVVTLESDDWWQEQLDVLEPSYPHTIKCPKDNLYGMHVYSKLRLINSSVECLVEEDIPSIHTLICLESGDHVRAHFLHPAPPSPTQNDSSVERDAELVIVAKSIAETDEPVIVTGDLNDVAWSETTRLFRKISGLLDPRIGRGTFNTFHAKYWFMRWPLDHVFHSHHFTLSRLTRSENYGSDHFAILCQLALTNRTSSMGSGTTVEYDDKQWAKAKTAQMSVSKEDVPQPDE